MSNKQWLLNHKAIRQAKDCIRIIEEELGVRLKLSHPQFLNMIKEYAEMTEATELQNAYIKLASLAGVETGHAQRVVEQKVANDKVVTMPYFVEERQFVNTATEVETESEESSFSEALERDEYVNYKGKAYKRFNDDGKEFKGLYRGRAHYR